MRIHNISEFYMHTIPEHRGKFAEFLSDAHKLGTKAIKCYHYSDKIYGFPTPTTEANIPAWTISNKVLSADDPNTHICQTAFWNTAVLMNTKLLYIVRSRTYQNSDYLSRKLSDTITYTEFVFYLNTLNSLCKSCFGLFAEFTSEFMFSQASLQYTTSLWYNNPYNKELLGKIVEHYQNKNLRNSVDNIVGKDIAEVLHAILEEGSSLKELENLAGRLYHLINNETPKQKQTAETNQEEEILQQGSNQQQNTKPEHEKDTSKQESSPEIFSSELQNISIDKGMVDTLDKMNVKLTGGGWSSESGTNKIIIRDVMKLQPNWTIEASNVFSNLGRILNQIKMERSKPIIPHLVGSRILKNKLFRMDIDRRVFGDDAPEKQKIKKETIIVVDQSGSTEVILSTKELQAAKGAYLSLREGREIVSVYGHTTEKGASLLIPIAKHGDSMINQRFDKATGVDQSANFDYFVLDWLVDHGFIYKNSLKIIIFLSDGQPCPRRDDKGIAKMKQAIKKARQKGYIVFSVSLAENVVHKNNVVYGTDWNIDASKGNLDNKLKDLFIEIVSKYKVR